MLNEIAKILFLFKTEIECGIEPDREKYAKSILSLPVEGFDCTLGELPERARKMKWVLVKILWTFTNEANDNYDIMFARHIELINDALTFNGSRIVKKSIPSSDEADRRKFEGGEMREIVLAQIAALYCKNHYGVDIKTTPDIQVYTDSLDFADQILSLPSGLIAGEHEITIGEALDDYQRIILDCPAYPCVGYFNGERIRRKE